MDPIPAWVRALYFIGFAIAYGWILHSAVERSVYKITGIRTLDSYFLSWLLGLVGAIPPLTFYVALGFNEFQPTPDGAKLQQRLHWAGRAQLVLLLLYGLIILATVPQK
jgi:hypothetical protein